MGVASFYSAGQGLKEVDFEIILVVLSFQISSAFALNRLSSITRLLIICLPVQNSFRQSYATIFI